MTITVYTINRETGERTDVQTKLTFLPRQTPESSLVYPRCECPTCTANQQRKGAR
jgi:hypothetical protein